MQGSHQAGATARSLARAPLLGIAAIMSIAAQAAQHVRAETPRSAVAAALQGRWTSDAEGGCARTFSFDLTGNTLRVTPPDGKSDVQRVLTRREAGVATETTSSSHGIRKGARWVYEVLAPGQLSLTDAAGRSVGLQRCHDPIPATATAAEFLTGLFDLYVADADASLPFAGEAGMRAFLTPDLADEMAGYAARLKEGGRVDQVCLSDDPITGAQDDYKVEDVHVDAAEPDPTADRTSGTASFTNMATRRTVLFELRRTPAGWRIDDLRTDEGPSLRDRMAPCAKPQP